MGGVRDHERAARELDCLPPGFPAGPTQRGERVGAEGVGGDGQEIRPWVAGLDAGWEMAHERAAGGGGGELIGAAVTWSDPGASRVERSCAVDQGLLVEPRPGGRVVCSWRSRSRNRPPTRMGAAAAGLAPELVAKVQRRLGANELARQFEGR